VEDPEKTRAGLLNWGEKGEVHREKRGFNLKDVSILGVVYPGKAIVRSKLAGKRHRKGGRAWADGKR